MEEYMFSHHVLDDYDDGMLEPTTMEDIKIERLYQCAPPAVYNMEAPPPLRIIEDCKLETQYSEGSGDEDDVPRRNGYSHITEMLRQVEPEEYSEDILKDILKPKSPAVEEDLTVILTKTYLNPRLPECVPKSDPGEASDSNVNSSNDSPRSVKSSEEVKCKNDMLKRASKAPRCRNSAIESLLKLRALEKSLKTPEDFSTSKSSTGSAASGSIPALSPRPSSYATPVHASPINISSPSPSNGLLAPNDDTTTSTEESVAQLSTPKKDKLKKKTKDYVLSESTTKLYEKYIQLDKQNSLSPKPSCSFETLVHISPANISGETTPSDRLATPIDSTPTKEANGQLTTPKNEPKKKKSKEFVPSENMTKLYEKYTELDKQKEIEKLASRTVQNNLSGFIEVKLQQLQKKEGKENGDSDSDC